MRFLPISTFILTLCVVLASSGPVFSQHKDLLLDELKYQIRDSYLDGDVGTAINSAKRAIHLSERLFGRDSLETADYVGLLGALLLLDGQEDLGHQFLNEASMTRRQYGISVSAVSLESLILKDYFKRSIGETVKVEGTAYERYLYDDTLFVRENDDYCLFDVNNDGLCDADDVEAVKEHLEKCLRQDRDNFPFEADLNGDLCITQRDLEIVEKRNLPAPVEEPPSQPQDPQIPPQPQLPPQGE